MRIKILKKFIGMILVLAMSLVLVTPAFAVDQCRASRDEQISAILDSVDMEGLYGEAEENMEQGQNENPYENISITCTATCENTMTRSSPAIDTEYGYAVRELGTLYDQYTGEETGVLYTVAAVSESRKISSDMNTEDRITTRLNLTWIDNFGVNNELVNTYGSWEYESTKEVEEKMVIFGTYFPILGFSEYIARHPAVEKMEFSYNNTEDIKGLTFASEASLYSIGYGRVSLLVVTSIND